MRVSPALISTLLLLGATGHGLAESQDRFVLERSGDRFVRLDRQTGAMSICTVGADDLVCKAARDDAGDPAELARLRDSVGALEGRVAKLETGAGAQLDQVLPSQEQVDRGMHIMEQFLRTFMGVVRDMDKDAGARLAPKPSDQKI